VLSKLIPYIDLQTNRFKKKYGLVERITETEGENTIVFPAMFKGGEEYEPVNLELQASYHRMNGPRAVAPSDNNTSGCSKGVTITYPMIMVGCLEIDQQDQYRFEQLANLASYEILGVQFDKQTRRDIKAISVEIMITSINSDRTAVWNAEFDGPAMNVPFNYTIFSIGYDLIIQADSSCLNTCCS
jgi:hypothetical protein